MCCRIPLGHQLRKAGIELLKRLAGSLPKRGREPSHRFQLVRVVEAEAAAPVTNSPAVVCDLSVIKSDAREKPPAAPADAEGPGFDDPRHKFPSPVCRGLSVGPRIAVSLST